MGEANDRGTEEERIAKAKLKNTLTPPICPGCGLDPLDPEQMKPYEIGFLCFPIPNMGVAHFTCPCCFCLMMNRECFLTQAMAREDEEKRKKQIPIDVNGNTPGGLLVPGRTADN